MRIYYAIGGDLSRKTEVATIMLLDRAVAMFALLVFPVIVLPWFPRVFQSMNVIPELIGGGAIIAARAIRFRNRHFFRSSAQQQAPGSFIKSFAPQGSHRTDVVHDTCVSR